MAQFKQMPAFKLEIILIRINAARIMIDFSSRESTSTGAQIIAARSGYTSLEVPDSRSGAFCKTILIFQSTNLK